MKRAFSILMLSALFVGSVGCSSAPKQQQPVEEPTTAAAVQEEFPDYTEMPEMPEMTESSTTTSSDSDLSLGAGSSGRGH